MRALSVEPTLADPRAALTPEQEEAAARRHGPLLLAAGAGSGKTSVLVERFVRAVREDGIAPGRILAVTFTERAAGELRERVRARLLELDERQAASDIEGAAIGTFHGFCARLLRVHALTAGLDPDFTILEESDAQRLRRIAFRGALAGLLAGERREHAVELLAAHGADRVRGMVLGVYAEQRSRGVGLPALPDPALSLPQPHSGASSLELEAVRACAVLDDALERFGRGYTELKEARSALDFDDLELRARDLLESHPGVRRMWSERLELVMVDEFQDTNRRQLALLGLLERDNLFTVGDELQSIYGFRHAEVEIFRERHRALAARGEAIALTRNFRGRPPLIAAVNSVFAERFGEAYTPLIAAREEADEGGPLIELLLTDRRGWAQSPHARAIAGELPAATLWRQAEARLLAQRVAELVAGGQAAAGEVAVLLRAAGDLPVYERALEERGLRTLAAVGSFWGHQQVGDLLAWLRALVNPLDELALYSALASPLVGISSDGLALVALRARAADCGAWAVIARGEDEELYSRLAPPDRERLLRFAERFATERHAMGVHGAAELLLRALAHSGYERHVLGLPWGERRLANIHKLLRLARRHEAAGGPDPRGFLDRAEEQLSFAEGSEPHAPTGSEPDAVRLMTIHAAKGLEFPVVCLADLGRTGNGAPPDLLVDGTRIGLRLARLDGSSPAQCLRYEELSHERRRAEALEEERIVYVAMTRARERLLLSGAADFERWPAERPGGAPIAWLAPALAPELPALARTLERPTAKLTAGGAGEGGATVLCRLNSPATVGEVLREESLGPDRATRAKIPSAEAPRRPTPAPVTTVPERPAPLSYTALSELERCGYRYYLERVLGLPEDRSVPGSEDRSAGRVRGGARRGDGLGARVRGVLIHRLLESLDFAHPTALEPHAVAAAARALGATVSPREREELAALVGVAATSGLARRVAAAEQVHREHPFAFAPTSSGELVTGVLDLLAREPDGGWLVVDYKSDRVGESEDLEALVQREYGVQRLLYALAALRAGAPRVEVVHWFLERPGEWVGARFGADEQVRLREQLLGRVERARARGFAVSDRPHRGLCLTCPGRARLCSWDEADTLRERSAGIGGPPAWGER